MKLRSLIFFTTLLTSSISFAGQQEGKVVQLLVHDNGANARKFDLILDNTAQSGMDWCSSKEQWTGNLDSQGAQAQYSMLLAALMAGKKVTVISDSTQNCPDGMSNRIRNLYINTYNP